MELWFSDYHTEKVKVSVKVQKQLFGLQTVKGAELVVPVAADATFPDFGIKISVHIEIVSEFGQILSGGGSLPGTEIGVQAFNLLNGGFGGLGFDKNAV